MPTAAAPVTQVGVTGSCPSGPAPTERGAGLAAVVVAATAFSWGFIIMKSVALPPPVLGLYRLAIGAAVLSTAALLLRTRWPRTPGWALAAGVAFGANQLFVIAATQQTSVAIVTLIGATQPLLVTLASRRTVGERVPAALFGWSLAAVAGVLIVVDANLGDPSQSAIGDVFAVAAVLTFTGYFLLAKRARIAGAPTLTMTASMLWAALAVVVPAALVAGPRAPTGRDGLLIALLALGPGNGHLLLNWAHRKVSAALASLVLAGLPLLSALWAHLILGEPYTWRHVVGMLLVVAAIEGGRRAEVKRAVRAAAAAPLPAITAAQPPDPPDDAR